MRFIVNQFSIAINKCANKCPANFERLRNNNIFPRIGDWAESAATFSLSGEMDVFHNTTHYVCSKVQTPKSSTFILFVFHFQTNVGFTQPTTIQWYTIWMVITSHSCSLLKEAFAMKTKKKIEQLNCLANKFYLDKFKLQFNRLEWVFGVRFHGLWHHFTSLRSLEKMQNRTTEFKPLNCKICNTDAVPDKSSYSTQTGHTASNWTWKRNVWAFFEYL